MRRWGPFGRLALFVLGHRKQTAWIAVALTLIGALIGLPPRVDTDLLSLLPQEDPTVAALARLHHEEGGANLVTLAFEGEDEALRAVTSELAASLASIDGVRYVLNDLDPDLAQRIALLQLDPRELRELNARVRGALALGPALNPIVTQRLMDMGPLTEKIARASEPPGWFGVHDGRARLLVRPTGSAHDQVFARALMRQVDAAVEAVDLEARGVRLTWIGGAYRHNVEDVAGVQRDIAVTSAASALLVLLVVGFAFRRPQALVIVFVPLVVANVVNFAVVRLSIGHLNTYTSFGSAVLIGLGIDFAVHLLSRYREERVRGRPLERAIARAWDRAGPPCATAALTSAAGFVALGVADFRGFSQLGLVLGTGLLLALLAMLVLLPLLIAWLEPVPPGVDEATPPATPASLSTYRLAPMGLMAFVLVTAFAGATRLPELEFEYDASATRRDGLAYAELSPEEQALARESYAPIIVSYEDDAALREAHGRLTARVAAGEMPHVARVMSIESVLPADQGERLDEVRDLAGLLEHPNLRYLPPPIVRPLLSLRGYDGAPLTREDLPPELLGLLGADREGVHRLLLFPQGNMWDMRVAEELAEEVEAAIPDRPVAGEQLTLAALFRLVRRDIPVVGLLAMVLVAALTAIDLRKLPRILGALGALVAGLVWAGAAVQGVGVKLSMLNVVGVPILLGIGVDVVIHLMHRLAEEGPGGVRRALRTTGVAAMVSALTTILSFASLWLASNRGVRSLGTLVVIGLSTVVLAAAVVLPLAWAAGWRMSGRAPAQLAPPRRHGKGRHREDAA